MKQCERGHFYDDGRYTDCPYCKSGAQEPGKTVGLSSEPLGKTMPLQAAAASPSADKGKTVAIIKKKIGLDPAVGFLVAIEGPHRGEDFRLHSGRNFIGRAEVMDVSLPDDTTVSRENHALLSYDDKNNTFVLVPGSGRGITYCNSRLIEAAVELTAYDKIEIGATTLLFLPLCGEHFQWT